MTKKKEIVIQKKRYKGNDGYKTFSVRIPEELLKKIETISKESGRSRNEVINIFLEFGSQNYVLTEDDIDVIKY